MSLINIYIMSLTGNIIGLAGGYKSKCSYNCNCMKCRRKSRSSKKMSRRKKPTRRKTMRRKTMRGKSMRGKSMRGKSMRGKPKRRKTMKGGSSCNSK
jgi:hypothetical protein